MKKDKRIEVYIIKSATFAIPILNHFRELVHITCMEAEETIKWGFPHFNYKNKMMCSMAAFKQHCAIGFWKASMMKDATNLKNGNDKAMGHYGRITDIKNLPSDKKVIAHIKEAMKLNEDGIKPPSKIKTAATPLTVPGELAAALSKTRQAKVRFDNFSPSNRNEYITWITEAKTIETKNRRISTTLEWLMDGKGRNWKYEKKK